ncbi:hypothetical protein GCM10007362_28450 [Saccharibacillus endophyticus]|uniref:Carbamate kinase n=2 Tax=Saccharibacillus endophyticus TaxID=2060666 RepID=A0ABQ1ZZ30_9BACL|nr:hypothetical protein GCM10007362_28450 [Saccharibacillus endophyticus]
MTNRSLTSAQSSVSSYMWQFIKQKPSIQARVHSIFSNGFNLKVQDRLWFVGKGEENLSAIGLALGAADFERIAAGLFVGAQVKMVPLFSRSDEQLDLTFTCYIRPMPITLTVLSIRIVDLSIPQIRLDKLNRSTLLHQLEKAEIQKKSGFASAALEQAYIRFVDGSDSFSAASLQPLIGAGVGLTPSGDDFLQGMILFERITGVKATITDLTRQSLQHRSTTDISLAYYQALFDGYANMQWINLFKAIESEDEQQIAAAIEKNQAYGATSGNDSLMGVLTFLRKAKMEAIMGKRIVVALGGNAILNEDPSTQGQIEALRHTSKQLIELIKQGHQLIISHGNGPQVGNLLLQQSIAQSEKNPALPLDTCVAMTQGSIGYWLQNTMNEAIAEAGLSQQVASIVTQVVVDENDPAFANPTKPIGPFFTQEEAEKLSAETGEIYVEDSGRGYRKVVPSPKPQTIVEYPIIKTLIENGYVTVSAGGGGIPVKKVAHGYEGVEAVIDKDFASANLANLVEADYLFLLTGVDNVYVNYNKPNQEKLENVTIDQLQAWIAEDQFAPGSMLPKVQAAISFAESRPGSKAVITSLENIGAIFNGGSATVVLAGNPVQAV